MSDLQQPTLSGGLIRDCETVMGSLGVGHQDAAVLVHAGAIAQHAREGGFVAADLGTRASLDSLTRWHPELAPLAELSWPAGAEQQVDELWSKNRLHTDDSFHTSYPLGDLYQSLSVESVKGRALCQTPWWVTELLLNISYVCHMKYSLALPFHALMHELLVPGGWCAQLTANSFMNRDFGEPYIEKWLAKFDLRWVIDTSGAYIPGHGTPTVILCTRNQPQEYSTVATVRSIQGEPRAPEDPSKGLVWSEIDSGVNKKLAYQRFSRAAELACRIAHPEPAEEPVTVPTQGDLFDLLVEGGV